MSLLFSFAFGIRLAAGHACVAGAGLKHGHAPALRNAGGADGEAGLAVAPVAAVRNKITTIARRLLTGQNKPQEDNTCWD